MWPSSEALSVCAENGVVGSIPQSTSVVGITPDFDSNKSPINGLRHPETSDSNGWYVWSGEVFPKTDDGFQPLCLSHLFERNFIGLRFLCLPPGWRFLLAGDHIDVWFDEALLKID